jgi:hypothetical protein
MSRTLLRALALFVVVAPFGCERSAPIVRADPSRPPAADAASPSSAALDAERALRSEREVLDRIHKFYVDHPTSAESGEKFTLDPWSGTRLRLVGLVERVQSSTGGVAPVLVLVAPSGGSPSVELQCCLEAAEAPPSVGDEITVEGRYDASARLAQSPFAYWSVRFAMSPCKVVRAPPRRAGDAG